MSFSIDVRGIDELIDGDDDPLRDIVMTAYGHRPLPGSRSRQTFYQFSYQALPPEIIKRVIGEIGDEIGLFIDKLPEPDPDDAFAPTFFSVTQLARELTNRYPEVASRTLKDVCSRLSLVARSLPRRATTSIHRDPFLPHSGN
jgi:hypothetical protein